MAARVLLQEGGVNGLNVTLDGNLSRVVRRRLSPPFRWNLARGDDMGDGF